MTTGVPMIGYVRVSTDRQGRSGLGLEAQQESLRQLAGSQQSRLVRVYTEVESGTHSDRPQLRQAIAHARRLGAVLAIAKLDRLARNMAFVATLMDSGVEFVAADNPHANRLTLHILAAVAEDEARRISDRTKAALAAYKARGGALGATRQECRNLTQEARQRGSQASAEASRRRAAEMYEDLRGVLEEMRDEGLSLAAMAERLNEMGHTTRRGCRWLPTQVARVLNRLGI